MTEPIDEHDHVCDDMCHPDDHHTCPRPAQGECWPSRPWCECMCHGGDEEDE